MGFNGISVTVTVTIDCWEAVGMGVEAKTVLVIVL